MLKWRASIFVFVIVLFVSLATVSASTWGNISEGDEAEIILNSPIDNKENNVFEVIYNITINITAGANANVTNISLWHNGTGTWHKNQTRYFITPTQLSHGEGDNSASSYDAMVFYGFRFTADETFNIDTIQKYANPADTTTRGYLLTANKDILASCTFVALNCTFTSNGTAEVTSGTVYYLATSHGTHRIQNSVTYPIDIGPMTLTTGLYNGSNSSTSLSTIQYVYPASGQEPQIYNSIISKATLWGIKACDSDDDCGYSENRTILLESVPPSIMVGSTSPIAYHRLNHNLSLTVNVSDLELQACWYDYSGTNVSYTCNTNLTSFNVTDWNRNITLYANDTLGNMNTTFFEWDYRLFSWSQTFAAQVYETSTTTFSELITALNSITSAELFYGGASKGTSSVVSGGGSNYTISDSIAIASSDAGTNSFYWNITTNGSVIQGSSDNQTVSGANFSLCGGAGGSVAYLNFTFKDETTSLALNASNDLSDFDYGLSLTTQNKSFISTNTTDHFSYAFCFTPPSESTFVDATFKYSKTGYPIRTYQLKDSELTNTTTNQVLYLLGSSDGIYSSIQTSEVTGTPISGVTLTIERQFGSVWTVVGVAVGGSDGLSTFWVNPNFDHRVTAVKTGYVTTQVTITPSQSLYSLVMTKTTGDADFSGSTEGMSWITTPSSGYLAPGSTYFSFNLTANLGNLDGGCKLEIVNSSQTIMNSTTGGNATACNIGLYYTHIAGELLYGKLYVDTTNTTGYILIDSDYRWVDIEGTDVSTWKTMFNFFTELKSIDEWGTGDHRQEWNRVVAFFLFLTIALGVFSYFTQYDAQYPGYTILIIGIIVFFASIAGWFVLGNASLIDAGYDKLDKFMIFLVTTFFSIGWYVGYLRRAT